METILLTDFGFIVTSETENLELWIASSCEQNYRQIYVYDSTNLTNLVKKFDFVTNFTSITSPSDSFIVPKVVSLNDLGPDYPDLIPYLIPRVQFFLRIPELHSANCNDSQNLNFAFPRENLFTFSISANSSGSCRYTIILPISYDEFPDEYTMIGAPILGLHINRIRYIGDSPVNVISHYFGPINDRLNNYDYLLTTDLFEISQDNAALWKNFSIYGSLIEFLIPPGGVLELDYASKSLKNLTDQIFSDHGMGLIQSFNYPIRSEHQDFIRYIRCSKGNAKINFTIVFADIPAGAYLRFTTDRQNITYYSTSKGNESFVLEATYVIVEYNTASISNSILQLSIGMN